MVEITLSAPVLGVSDTKRAPNSDTKPSFEFESGLFR